MTVFDRTLRRLTARLVEAERYADTLPMGSAEHAVWTSKVSKLRGQLRCLVSTSEPLHPIALEVIRHALGVKPDKRGPSGGYRNRYVVSEDLTCFGAGRAEVREPVHQILGDLEHAGYVEQVPSIITVGRLYRVTEAGAKAAGCLPAWKRWMTQ